MDLADRSAAVSLKAAERPDVRALRSALDRVERNLDALLENQNDEIQRLRRIILKAVDAYRVMAAASWRGSKKRMDVFTAAFDLICLEADAIRLAGDVEPKKRPAKKRG